MRIRSISAITLVLVTTLTGAAFAKGARSESKDSSAHPIRTLAPPANDQCAGAIPIPCGNINLSGNTDQATNNYTFADTMNSCTGYAEDGRDVVYLLNVGPGDSLWINYQNRSDGSLYIVSDCNNIDGTCLVGVDDFTTTNSIEQLRYKFVTGGTYYLILDSYGVNTSGLWTAVGQLVCGASSPPSNDLCQTASPLGCGSFLFSGSTVLAHDNVTTPALFSCTGFQALGNDVVYKLTVTAGDSVWIRYTSTANATMYIVGSCTDVANTCVWGEDQNSGNGEPETLSYKFTFSGTYYLVLDSRAAGSSGTWTAWGDLTCVNPPPANDRCENAYVVGCGPISWSGSTLNAVNDYEFPDSVTTCTGFDVNGNDVVYRFNANVGDQVQLTYDMNGADASMYLVTDCSDTYGYCIAGLDEAFFGEQEVFNYTFTAPGIYYLILDSVDRNIPSAWTAVGTYTCNLLDVPGPSVTPVLSLRSVWPNPFRSTTTLFYQVPSRAPTSLHIFDLQGREVRQLFSGDVDPGEHTAVWDGRDDQGVKLGPGVYFAHLASGQAQVVRRMIFVR